MTITLERPRSEAAYFDTNRLLPVVAPETRASGRPSAAAPTKAAIPAGGRLVRRRTGEAPTLSLGRKLKMLAPVALLAGVSAASATVVPQIEGLIDGVRDHFADAAATGTPDSVAQQGAAPKHRAAEPAAPDVVPAPRRQPTHRPKHRAPAPTDATRPTTDTSVDSTSPAGSHAAERPSGTPAAKATGGKHRATPSTDQGDDQSSPQRGSAPPSDQPPSSDSPKSPDSPSSDPVTNTVKSVADTLKSVTGPLGLS